MLYTAYSPCFNLEVKNAGFDELRTSKSGFLEVLSWTCQFAGLLLSRGIAGEFEVSVKVEDEEVGVGFGGALTESGSPLTSGNS